MGERIAKEIRIEGIVQGVGFRPFVYRLATERHLCGTVLNDSQGVLIKAEGTEPALCSFIEAIAEQRPPLASISRMQVDPTDVTGAVEFAIIDSQLTDSRAAQIAE